MTITALTSKPHPPSVGISGLTQYSAFRRGAERSLPVGQLCARLITGASAEVQNSPKKRYKCSILCLELCYTDLMTSLHALTLNFTVSAGFIHCKRSVGGLFPSFHHGLCIHGGRWHTPLFPPTTPPFGGRHRASHRPLWRSCRSSAPRSRLSADKLGGSFANYVAKSIRGLPFRYKQLLRQLPLT